MVLIHLDVNNLDKYVQYLYNHPYNKVDRLDIRFQKNIKVKDMKPQILTEQIYPSPVQTSELTNLIYLRLVIQGMI
ncbi:unnamed protein product [Paramecium primaurelia]|uniref:Uncharacterized protein n=1 Tax=Paramecium primaurelia TaxID=5886 RepID=A0A8S1QCD2_PARPR|nr:unnamed protein product [Paramecium primaurelia]